MNPPVIPNGRSLITVLFALADRAMATPPAVAASPMTEMAHYRSEPYRKHREAWVLGRFSSIYNVAAVGSPELSFAEPGDSPDIPADFAVFDATGAHVADVEITELTDVWKWFLPGLNISEVTSPWAHLPELLQKKFEKSPQYRNPTWLIVYDNASSGIFPELDCVALGAAEAGRAIAHTLPSESNITAIWILSSDGRRAEHVYPAHTPDTGWSR